TYSPLTDNAAIFDKQGNIITSNPKNENELNNVSLRSYFAEPMKTKAAYLSPVFFTKSGQPVIVLGIPIINTEQEIERVVGLRIELLQNQMMQSFFEHFDIGENGYTYIVDQNGRVLFHPQKERIAEDVNENVVVKELMQGNSGYQKVTNLQGSDMLASYRFIPYLHWGIVAQIPVESTLFSLEAFEDRIEKLALLLLLPLIILVGLHTRRTIEPIKRLQKAVDEVTNGNYDGHIPTNGKNEIEVLFQQFNNMVDTIRQNRKNLNLKRQELLEKKVFLRQILDLNPNFIFARNQEGKYTLVNHSKAVFTGLKMEEILGKSELEINHDTELAQILLAEDREVLTYGKDLFIPERIFIDSDGQKHYLQTHKIPIFNANGQAEQVLCILTDITEQKKRESEIEYLAYHDHLTNLPNRMALQEQVSNYIVDQEEVRIMAMLFLDLDQFKLINDSLGHMIGDELLKKVVERFQWNLPSNAIMARMGGDEFAVFLKDVQEEVEAESMAQSLMDGLRLPFQMQGREFHITTSVGISFYPKDGITFENLLKKADTAMHQAKKQGKNQYEIFQPAFEQDIRQRLEMEGFLRKALEEQEFFLVYQPKVDLQTNKICGMEALIRWKHPILGIVSPDKFIPLAEENGMILTIGEWVLHEACSQNKKWQEEGLNPVRVSVNLSVKQLLDPELLNTVDRILKETKLEPNWLELEITESMLIEGSRDKEVIVILKSLQDRGVSLSIDDFGTGYSSLSYLKKFPIQTLKIDRSFINDLLVDEEGSSIVRGILSIGKSLNLRIIAEGVEEVEQMEFLRREGCHEIQGYLISRPLSTTDFTSFLQKIVSIHF
ncbi:MAG TPA: EAL domain-containing protein, partial [Bacillota bacterium]|nr:EAL domain-containing protein [Bacillota bacterium]